MSSRGAAAAEAAVSDSLARKEMKVAGMPAEVAEKRSTGWILERVGECVQTIFCDQTQRIERRELAA